MAKKKKEAPEEPVADIKIPTKKEIEEITGKKPIVKYRAEEAGKDKWAVVSQTGETVRVYEKSQDIKDPKACAESYAKKLSN